MKEYAVVQTIRVGRKNRLVTHARVLDVPDGVTVAEVEEAITEAGRAPAEAGIVWANHIVRDASKVKGAEDAPRVAQWPWKELSKPRQRQLNVRVPASLYAAVEAASEAAGVPLRQWCEEAIRTRLEGEALRAEGPSV